MNKSTTRKRFKVKKIKEKHLQNAKVKGFLYTEYSFAYQNTTKTNTQSIENHVASSWSSYSKCCFMAACRVSLSHAEPSGRHSVFQPPCFCFCFFVWGGLGVSGPARSAVPSWWLPGCTWYFLFFPLHKHFNGWTSFSASFFSNQSLYMYKISEDVTIDLMLKLNNHQGHCSWVYLHSLSEFAMLFQHVCMGISPGEIHFQMVYKNLTHSDKF